MKRNSEKVVWVTGASSGIGRAVAKKFADEGHNVVVSARRKALLHELTSEIKHSGGKAFSIQCDVTSEKSVNNAFKKISELCGGVDVLIVNAGATEFKSLLDTSVSEFDKIIDTNLKGAFLCIKSVLPYMIKRKSGHIILVLSVAANTVFENSSVYSASKAGAYAMANCLRKEVRSKGIKVTSVIPGAVDTEMWDDKSRRLHSQRMMTPHHIAEVTYDVFQKPSTVHIEDLIVRPSLGDL